jgi:hypothetical protein
MTETATAQGYDYGPLRTYEITWRDRAPEMVQGHQVLHDTHSMGIVGLFGRPDHGLPPKFHIHGSFDGHWRLVISALEADAICIRDVTEQVAALEAIAEDG